MKTVGHAAAGAVLFAVLAPGTVVGLAPWLLARWVPTPELPGALRPLGVALILPGAVVLLDSMARFVRARGTPAPVAPTEHLVIGGLYRRVRNPMYVAIVVALVGEALVYARAVLLAYAAGIWLVFHLFVVFQEEPSLRKRFGSEYEGYRRRVPRWLPRP